MQESIRLYCGIDIGKHGGMSYLDESGVLLHYCNFPRVKGNSDYEGYDVEALGRLFDMYKDKYSVKEVLYCMEKIWAIPGYRIQTAFSLGIQLGILRMLLRGRNKCYVYPRQWQGHYWEKLEEGETSKTMSKKVCENLYGVGDDLVSDGITDSILIARYVYDIRNGNIGEIKE